MYNATTSTFVSKVTIDKDQEFFSKETSVLQTWSTPTWQKELQDLTVEERDRGVELVCVCKDLVRPSAKWFHKGREVFSHFHMKLRQVEETASLTIKEIREQDTGIFKCVITGDNGQLETSCVLTVKASEVILPPVFVKELHDLEVEEGEQLELAVEVRGTPPVGVFWLHNNMEITRDNHHFSMASLGHVHTLSLLRATTKYSGEYVCEAYNDFGDTDTFCFVEVRETETLDPPGFVSCPSPVTAKEGETITFTCQVKGQPMPTVLWERGGVAIATSQKYKITKIQEQHTLTIFDVNQADAGDYVCQLHGSGSEISHTCSLYVTSDLHPRHLQPAETVKTRLVYIRDLHETDQIEERSTLQQGIPGFTKMTSSIQHNNPRNPGNRSRHAEGRHVATEASRTLKENKIEPQSTIYVHPSSEPQSHSEDHDDVDFDNRCQFKGENGEDIQDSSSSKTFIVNSQPITKNIRVESTKQQTCSETKPNYHSVLSKAQRKVEEKKAVINTGATDFRSILKHRVKSPPRQTAKSVKQTEDLQKSSSRGKEKTANNENLKEDNLAHRLVNMPSGKMADKTLSQNAEFISLSYSQPTSLSHSKPTALSTEEIPVSNQRLRNKSSRHHNATAVHGELALTGHKSAQFRHAAGASETPASSEYVENLLSEQKLCVSAAPAELDHECIKINYKQNIVNSDKNLTASKRNNAGSADFSATSFMADQFLDNKEGQENVGSLDSPSREQSYVSEIQIMNKRTDGRKDSETSKTPHAEHNFKISSNATSSPDRQSHTRPRGSFSQAIDMEQESSPSYKVSIVHINPEVPHPPTRSDDFKLEVTSVSMSVPLRSSASSPRSHSSSNSVSAPGCFPGQTSVDRYDDTEDVFDDVNEERQPAQTVHTSNSNDHKATLQSFGPSFTWEKAPWDMQKVVQDDSTLDIRDNKKEFESKVHYFLENVRGNDSNHQSERSFMSACSVNSKIRSASDCDILPSSVTSKRSVQAVKNAANDFRTLTLKPAAGKVKSDLIRSKFISASTECVFADVKLKSVSKMNDGWRKSQVSLNTERVHNVSQSRESVSRPWQDLSQPKLKMSQKTKTGTKLSENLSAPANNTKSQNQNENVKSVNKSKIKTVAEKYEKSSLVTAPRTKSKGIGAKFEASLKDSQVSARNTFRNLPNSAKKNVSEINASKSAAGGDMKSGKVFEKIQHWKVAEMKLSENSEKKMLGSLGKSNSHDNVLERGKDTYKILESSAPQKRHSLQTDVLPTSQSITFAKSELAASAKVFSKTSQMYERVNVNAGVEDCNETSHGQVGDVNKIDTETSTLDSERLSSNSAQQAGSEKTVHGSILDKQNLKQTASQKFKAETSENKHINANKVELSSRSKGGSPKSAHRKQDAKPDLIIRKPLNVVETIVIANISDKNQQTKIKSEWTSSRSSKQFQMESAKENKQNPPVNNAGIDTETLMSPENVKTVQTATLITNITPTVAFFDSPSTASNVLASAEMASLSPVAIVIDKASSSSASNHIQEPSGTPCTVSIEKDINLPTTFRRSSITQGPLEETSVSKASGDPNSIHTSATARKDAPVDCSKHKQALHEPSSEDHLSHIDNFKSSWVRQKHQKSIPAHQSHDMGLILYQEHLRSSMDDSESVLSTTSISSSSSDASTVTVDSGYPRYSSRKYLDNDRIELPSKTTHPGQTTTSVTVSHPGKLDKQVKNTADSFQKKKNFFEHVDSKMNVGGQFKLGDGDKNIHILASNLKHTTGARDAVTSEAKATVNEDITGLGTCEGPQLTSDSIASFGLEQASSQRKHFVNEVTIVREPLKEDGKGTDQIIDTKDTEDVADLTYDFGTIRKYSKKRRKQIQVDVNAGTIVLTSPDAEHPTPKSIEEVKTHATVPEIITVESDITFKPEESTGKYKAKETRMNIDSEGTKQKSTLTRRWRVEENINKEKDNKQQTKPFVDTKSSVTRPTDLDLTASWRHRKPKEKPDTEHKDVKITSQSQEEVTKATTAPLEDTSITATSDTPSPEHQHQQYPPSFPVPLRDTKVILGSTAVLFCQVIGDPRPEVKWLLNYNQVEPSENIEILYSQDIAQLTVKETFTEHVGDYSCWAKNVLGTVSTHCTLNLEASNKTEGRAFEGPVFSPPKIVSFAPSSLTLVRGECLSLTATFRGEPNPAVRWMHGDRELIPDNHVEIVTEANSSCLTIQSVSRSDAGKMSVCLTSTTGADQASTNIYIEDVPGSPVGRPHVYDIDRNSASLSWCGPAYSEGCQVTHYIIETKTRQDQAWDVIVPHCKDQSCHILDLKPCTTYQFRVLAANKYGLSAPSEPSDPVYTSDPYRSPSDYESEDDLPFEPREVKINTGEQFDNVYELHKEVGKGKFGIVYKCKHKTDETIWAAKIVKCREQDKKVIRREIEIMNKLRHPKLLMLWDAYEGPRQMVLVTEFVSAGELFERVIGEDFVLTECDCIHFLRQICEGVSYMHSNNILHLDLKPENILCIAENSNRIKIIDFGLAQFYHPGQSTKVLFGTPEFIAPEVINYDEISFATDMWSIGVICYVLLSGLSPFLGDNDAETLASVTSGEYDFDDEAFDEISDDAKDFISRLLVKKKEHRLLTDQCLSHVWLAQHETGSVRRRRLNTERLKRFMVRRKWLKTGNAVLAVSRLLKSSNLAALSSLSNNSGGSNESSDTESSVSPQLTTIHRNTDTDTDNMLNQGIPKTTRNQQSTAKLWRNTSPEELTTTNVNFSDFGLMEEELSNSDLTDRNDNQIHSSQLPASGSDDNHNNQPMPVCTDSIKTVSTEAEQGSTAKEGRLPAAPVFVKSMINSDACIGDVARFDVVVSGNPLPGVTWCFEGEEIFSGSRHSVEMNETTRSFSLIIRSIVEEDEGEYTCKAVNSHGEAFCVAELSVLDM